MQFSKVRVLEYSDGITYVQPWSDHVPQGTQLVGMIKNIMNHRNIEDLSNTYVECSVQLLRSRIYHDIMFTYISEGLTSCSGIICGGISSNYSNRERCIIFYR